MELADDEPWSSDGLAKMFEDAAMLGLIPSAQADPIGVRGASARPALPPAQGTQRRSMVSQVGGSLPLHVGAAPRILLAFEGPDLWDRYLAQTDLRGMVSTAPLDRGELVRGLEEICRLGYATADGDTALGMAGIAAPVFDFTGRLRASISMSGPSGALEGGSRGANVDAVVRAAAEISMSLGFHPRPSAGDTSRHLAWLRPTAASRASH